MKSFFVVIVVNDVAGQGRGINLEPTVGGTVAASWDVLGYFRYFTVVVAGNEDGSRIMKSGFVFIVVSDVVGSVGGRSETDCWMNCSCLSGRPRGRSGTSPFVVQGDEDWQRCHEELLRCHRG